MNPLIIDVILIVISILLIWNGFRHGFIRAAGSLIGLVLSIGLGIWGVTWLEDLIGIDLTSNPVIFISVFLTLAIFLSQIIRLLVNGLGLIRRLLSVIPFVGLIDRVLGLVLGLVQAAILITAVAFVTITYLPEGSIKDAMIQSMLVGTGVELVEMVSIF